MKHSFRAALLLFLLLASSLRDERSGFFFALTPRFSGLYVCTASVCHAHARGETISLLIASPIISVLPSPPLPRLSLNLLPGGGDSLFRFRRLCKSPSTSPREALQANFREGKREKTDFAPNSEFPTTRKGEGK